MEVSNFNIPEIYNRRFKLYRNNQQDATFY